MSTLNILEITFLLYFLLANGSYIFLTILSFFSIRSYMKRSDFRFLPAEMPSLNPPITVIVPARNEAETIVETVESLRTLRYPNVEIIVVDDQSTDSTLDRLNEEYQLSPTRDVYREKLPTEDVQQIYRSERIESLHVLHKRSAGAKGDALNAGLNFAETPLVCCIDADSILDTDCLNILVRPFLWDHRTVAAGGTIRVANGSTIQEGRLTEVGLPDHPLELFQVMEYLRAFLFGRMGWVPVNGLPIISGALGLFDRETLMEVGGFKTDTVSEDMEVVLRMHRILGDRDQPYRIQYLPDPICWTQVPADINSLRSQRISWQQGLFESLSANRSLLGNRKSPGVGWMSYPYLLLVEGFGSVIEVLGYGYMAAGVLFGYLSEFATVAFLVLAIGMGIFHSVFTLLLEVLSFHVYPRISQIFKLFTAALAENLGYRQVNSLWRFYGLLRFLTGRKGYPGHKKKSSFRDPGRNQKSPRNDRDTTK